MKGYISLSTTCAQDVRLCSLHGVLSLNGLLPQAGIVGEVTQVGKEASGEELRDKFWEGQTYEGWENVFRTNVSSGAYVPLCSETPSLTLVFCRAC